MITVIVSTPNKKYERKKGRKEGREGEGRKKEKNLELTVQSWVVTL